LGVVKATFFEYRKVVLHNIKKIGKNIDIGREKYIMLLQIGIYFIIQII